MRRQGSSKGQAHGLRHWQCILEKRQTASYLFTLHDVETARIRIKNITTLVNVADTREVYPSLIVYVRQWSAFFGRVVPIDNGEVQNKTFLRPKGKRSYVSSTLPQSAYH